MKTLAIMFTFSTYGTWLRGDPRGWVDDGVVFPPDPQLQDMDRRSLRYPSYKFARQIRHEVGQAMGESLISRLNLVILAMAVQSWHTHVIVAATVHPVSKIAKCAKDAVRWKLRLDRPIWATDFDKRFTFEPWLVRKRIDYVELHNVDDGLPRRPWDFIQDWKEPS